MDNSTGERDKYAEIERYAARVRGCILGGAIGDALGWPVEFTSLPKILAQTGPKGVRGYLPMYATKADYLASLQTDLSTPNEAKPVRNVYGHVTDDTQMTLFTMDGLIRAGVRLDKGIGFNTNLISLAYDRWLDTQQRQGPNPDRDDVYWISQLGWLDQHHWLYVRRAPGNTCLRALKQARKGKGAVPTEWNSWPAENNSKGCGGVMRVAPIGLVPYASDLRWAYDEGARAASYTHGHPTGQVASGALAAIVAGMVHHGQDLPTAVSTTLEILEKVKHHEETTEAIKAAVALADNHRGKPESIGVIEKLGQGWIAEEALAMALYAALRYPEPHQVLDALSVAVTHNGDSDSTGAICGNILGALHGDSALPAELVFRVEGRETMLALADDFIYEFTQAGRLHDGGSKANTGWEQRYPPH
ncbi:MAG: ADP-ribosylglycohydrolase family protein [Cellulomonadaceae bacterium]|nr:ADP-ribosylglycohydrolase family protein [Cellulomonadaceae bacterium]